MTDFKNELSSELEKEVKKLVEEHINHVDRIYKFLPQKHKIGDVLNDELIDEICSEFDLKALEITLRLREKYAKKQFPIIKEFKKQFAQEIKNVSDTYM